MQFKDCIFITWNIHYIIIKAQKDAIKMIHFAKAP